MAAAWYGIAHNVMFAKKNIQFLWKDLSASSDSRAEDSGSWTGSVYFDSSASSCSLSMATFFPISFNFLYWSSNSFSFSLIFDTTDKTLVRPRRYLDHRQSNTEKESRLNSKKDTFCYFEKRGRPLSTWNRSSSLICKKKSASYITNIKEMKKESKMKKAFQWMVHWLWQNLLPPSLAMMPSTPSKKILLVRI